MEAPTDAFALRLDCRVRTSRRIGRVFDSGRGFFSSGSSWRVSTTPLSPANWTSLAWSYTTSIISSSPGHQGEVIGRLAQLSATRTPVRVPESRLSNLPVDLRRHHPIANQSWLQMPALLDFPISFVVNDTAELEVDPAPAPSLCLRKQSWYGWAICLGWLDGKESREHTKTVYM